MDLQAPDLSREEPEARAATDRPTAAGDLHGRLLVAHGLRDDNVHFQNTAQFIDALQAAGKDFDLMIYPRDRHGIGSGADHYRELRRDYILENL